MRVRVSSGEVAPAIASAIIDPNAWMSSETRISFAVPAIWASKRSCSVAPQASCAATVEPAAVPMDRVRSAAR